MSCLVCGNAVVIQERIKCCTCKGGYHYQCLGITDANYLTNPQKYDFNWRCPDCKNVTKRSKNHSGGIQYFFDLSYDSEAERSVLGDTLAEKSPQIPAHLKQLSDLLDEKLNTMKGEIVAEITSTIETKLFHSIKRLEETFSQKFSDLQTTQTNITARVSKMEKKIEDLEKERDKLQFSLQEISSKITSQEPIEISAPDYNQYENQKKFVLYGLNETHHEDEWSLIDQLQDMFRDLYNINISGFIETATRVGSKRSKRRPIVVELISKRMTKYIIDNTVYLKNTGLFISEYLDKSGRQNRKTMLNMMRNARKDGKHAVIINNKLIINGEEQKVENNIRSSNRDDIPQNEEMSTKGNFRN
ncbi:hypothetical protein NE865_07667 [Phthorimaea operculella]|nr:hypothetical protein NE865_07667 [Phthorimaea operculella]